MKKLSLTQIKVTATQLDQIESELSNTALFTRDAGTIIDLVEAKEQVGDLNSILPKEITAQDLDKDNIQYLELYM